MENNKNKKSVKFQGDMLNFCDFIQIFVFTRNHHLNYVSKYNVGLKTLLLQGLSLHDHSGISWVEVGKIVMIVKRSGINRALVG